MTDRKRKLSRSRLIPLESMTVLRGGGCLHSLRPQLALTEYKSFLEGAADGDFGNGRCDLSALYLRK